MTCMCPVGGGYSVQRNQSPVEIPVNGHIQTLVNPPGNFKARYYASARLPEDPDEWFKGAAENKGTWWDHWIKWIGARSGGERPAPKSLGSELYKAGERAPGLYVRESH